MDALVTDLVIGLEVHVQLATSLKLFCADMNAAGDPNSHVCPVCLGLPGALPVLDGEAVDLAVRAAAALDCNVQPVSRFERKSYFYPDLPKGYQITQHAEPLAVGGVLRFNHAGAVREVQLRRLHIEEDAGRLNRDRFDDAVAIDFNRAGVALIEIVTEPELRSAAEARAFLVRLRQTLRYAAVSDCDMENGTLRVDANVSLSGGPRVEIKNLNSFAYIEKAIEFEARRQAALAAAGRQVERETRGWDARSGETRPLRSKESIDDYRYMPEPDLPAVYMNEERIEAARSDLPELPAAREARFMAAYDLPSYDAAVLTAEPDVAALFEATAHLSGDPLVSARWIMGPVLAWLNRTGSRVESVDVEGLAGLIGLVRARRVSAAAARTLLDDVLQGTVTPAEALHRSGLEQVSGTDEVNAWVSAVLAEHPEETQRLRAGETRILSYLMGQVMRKSGGKADPRVAARLIEERIDA